MRMLFELDKKDYIVGGSVFCRPSVRGIIVKDGTLVGAGAYIAHTTDEWSVYTPPRTYKLEGKSSLDFKL